MPADGTWCSFVLGFMHDSDWDTVAMAIESLEDLNVRLKVKDRAALDVRIISVARQEGVREKAQGGIYVSAIDNDGMTTGSPFFVRYEDIVMIDVY